MRNSVIPASCRLDPIAIIIDVDEKLLSKTRPDQTRPGRHNTRIATHQGVVSTTQLTQHRLWFLLTHLQLVILLICITKTAADSAITVCTESHIRQPFVHNTIQYISKQLLGILGRGESDARTGPTTRG